MALQAPDDGPGCGHEICLFERDCLVLQDAVELEAARDDRVHRETISRAFAEAIGLGRDEGPLLEVCAYSPDLRCRLAAAAMVIEALERVFASEDSGKKTGSGTRRGNEAEAAA